MFQGEGELSRPRQEKEGLMCSRLAQETGRKDHLIGWWVAEERQRRGARLNGTWLALFRTLLSTSEQRGKPWQSFKQGRNIVRSVSPTESGSSFLSSMDWPPGEA